MRELSEKYKELASRAGRYPKLRMEVYEGTRGEWTDTVEQEYSGENAIVSATYTNGITVKPSRFETGLAFCGSLELELSGDTYATLSTGKRFKLFAGFYDPEEDEIAEAAMGEFFVESISTDKGKTTLKSRDKMMFAEQKFNAKIITYPCSLLDCVREIFRQMGFIIPEDYTLDINPTVRAPAWQKPNMTEGVYSNGTFYVEDPLGYGITMPGSTTPTKGHAYSATGFALTCREALESVAKMQLGNCFIDGDGIPRFSSYKSTSSLGDDRVTGLTVGEDRFIIDSLLQNYMGYDVESVALFKRRATERRGEIMYYTNFPSDLPESYDPVRSRVIGKTFYEGTAERKGLGETEIGEFIDYSGKLGKRRFFVFGLQYEWSGASFDETLYSFAPDYKGVDYEWMNDRDLVEDEDKEDEPKEEEKPETPTTPESGLNIDKAVIITEADAKYLLHDFTQVEYIAGNKIGYAGPGNQIVVQGYLAYTVAALNAGANYVSGSYIRYPADWTANISRYMEFSGDFYYGNNHYKRAYFVQTVTTASSASYNFYLEKEDGTTERIYSVTNQDHWSGFGLALEWLNLYPPGSVNNGVTFENGYATARFHYFWKSNFSQDYVYERWYINNVYIFPFASLAEYQAAVGLTYEPLTLTEVVDNPTVVSGKDIGREVT